MGIIESPLLVAFRAVVETGTVHAAAKRLGLTQTAITKRIRALEDTLSVPLFLRSRRGMELTNEGTTLLQHSRATEELEGALLSRLSGKQKGEVQLTIVGPTSAISTRIARNCRHLYRKYPYLRIHLRSDDHSNLVELVRKGIADLAVVSPGEVPNEMESKLLKPDRYLLVGSNQWKGRSIEDIVENERIIDFYKSDQTTRKYLANFNVSPPKRERIYVNENQALIQLFSEGVGFGTLTEEVARAHLESGDLIALNRGRAMADPLALTWYSRSQKVDYFSDLIRAIK